MSQSPSRPLRAHLRLTAEEQQRLETHRYSGVFIVLSLLIGSVSLINSFVQQDFTWFQRSGSLITILGLAHIQRFGRLNPGVQAEIEQHHSADDQAELDNLFDVCRARVQDRASIIAGAISLPGTLIWGYGDLLGCLFYECGA
jgi:Na+-transporting methylmalonyl-CoA/oxaloacetate decarboxylase gamma subunit